MAGIYGYSREAVRVKVKKCESNNIEWRKFSVDPQITTVEVLYSILAKAFDIRSDFSISYRAIDPTGHEQFLSVLSDWDLDAAFLRTHNNSVQTGNEPCLYLRVDIKAFSEANDWEVNSPLTGNIISGNNNNNNQKQEYSPIQQSFGIMGQKYVQNMQTKLPGLIMNHVEKTFSMVQRALNFAEEQIPTYPPRQPLSDIEFRSFLDSVGQILRPNELRKVIFLGGIDPSLRRVVWKHILNVYPNGMTGRERMDYMKRKAFEYYRLRDIWKLAVQQGPVNGELAYVTSMVRKDVLRTDRLNQFYAGSDDNQNIASLFNVLTTYALNHPSVSYCQGMSDLASPLLVTMSDEAHAYICFCAIMSRLQENFMLDGIAMTLKFNHLAEAIQYYDPEFYEYLKSQQADDLLFCYRWLLLELKREFPFEDSLRMLEVQWSSLHNEPPEKELKLYEKEFTPQQPIIIEEKLILNNDDDDNNDGDKNQQQQQQNKLNIIKSPSGLSAATIIMRQPRENHYTKVCALRRQSSSLSLQSNSPDIIKYNNYCNNKLDGTKRLNQSLDENISRDNNQQLNFNHKKNIVKTHQSLDEQKMLMLMKSVSIYEINKSDDDDNDDDEIDRNDELKSNTENIIKLNDNNDDDKEDQLKSKVQFHPTNPFLDDALDDVFMGNNVEILRPKILNDINNDKKNFNNEENIDDNQHKKDIKHNNINNNNNNKHGFNHISHKTIMKVPNNNINSNNHKNTKIFSNTGNILTKQLSNKKGGGHFKDLKDKIAASKKGILASLDKMESQFELTTSNAIINRSTIPKQDDIISIINSNNQDNNIQKRGQKKVVKNFNEFLNFTSSSSASILNKNNHNSISDKLIQNSKIHSTQEIFEDNKIMSTTITDQKKYRPLIKFKKKQSFDDSDSSVTTTTTTPPPATTQIIDDITNEEKKNQLSLITIKHPLQLQLNTLTQQQQLQQQQSFDGSSPDDSQDYYPMTTSITRELRLEMENLDRQVFGEQHQQQNNITIINEQRTNKLLLNNITDISYEKFDCSNNKNSIDLIDVKQDAILSCPEDDDDDVNVNDDNNVIIRRKIFNKKLNNDNDIIINNDQLKRISTCSNNTDIFIWENPLHQISGTSSCNFNEILIIDNNDETIKSNNNNNNSKICLPSICTDHSNTIIDQQQQQDNQTTPDEQQDLEYDGDIIIECDGDNINKRIHKSCTPLRLIQQSSTTNNTINNDSDSDNTTENNLWKNQITTINNLNPFFTELKTSNDDLLNIDNNIINQDIEQITNYNNDTKNLINLNNPNTIINPQLLLLNCEEASETNEISFSQKQHQQQQQLQLQHQQQNKLPSPNEFGGGNPFLIFLCLTLLLQHRNTIIKNNMDYNEMAMHFDKMVRKHDVNRVLNQARRMYFEYLKAQQQNSILTGGRTGIISGCNNVDGTNESTKS